MRLKVSREPRMRSDLCVFIALRGLVFARLPNVLRFFTGVFVRSSVSVAVGVT